MGAQVCSDKCRKRVSKHGANVVQIRLNIPSVIPTSELPIQGDQSTPEKPASMSLVNQTFIKLRNGNLLKTVEGQMAMTLASRKQI